MTRVEGFELAGTHDEAKRLGARARKGLVADATLAQLAHAGSSFMRLAALEAIAAREPARAEALAPIVLPHLHAGKDLRRAAQLLYALGTDRATDLAIEQTLANPRFGCAVHELADPHRARLFARLAVWLPRLALGDPRILTGLGVADALASPLVTAASRRGFAVALAADVTTPDEVRARAFQILWQVGDEDARLAVLLGEASSLPYAVRARVLLAADPARAFDLLVDDFRTSPSRHHVILDRLDATADPRWSHEVLALAPGAPAEMTAVLARMRAADELTDLAARLELDEVACCALLALARLGDPRGSRLLVDWLQRPEGAARAPMILTALGTCGDAEALGVLEARLAHAGKRRAFYELAIDEIRTRLGR